MILVVMNSLIEKETFLLAVANAFAQPVLPQDFRKKSVLIQILEVLKEIVSNANLTREKNALFQMEERASLSTATKT